MRVVLVLVALAAVAAASPYPPYVLKNMNLSADPCNDFYEYACGGWIAATTRPPTQPVVDKSITTISDRNAGILLDIVANHTYDKLRPMYDNCMNRTGIDALGPAPLQPLRPSTFATLDDAVKFAGGVAATLGGQPFFSLSAVPNPSNPFMDILEVDQGGFTLPSRDMYNDTSLAAAYTAFITQLFTLAGDDASVAKTKAAAVVAFETQLADAAKPLDDIRDPFAVYNPTNVSGLEALSPEFPWATFLAAANITVVGPSLNVGEPSVVTAAGSLVASAALDTLFAYLDFMVINTVARQYLLPQPFVNATFDFWGKMVDGQSTMQQWSAVCVSQVNTYFGDLVSKYYVQVAFAGNAKASAAAMVSAIQAEFAANLKNVTWMDEATQSKAIEKQKEMTPYIGYPDVWKNYTDYHVMPGRHLETAVSFMSLNWRNSVTSRINQTANRKEWDMEPDVVNAYYDPTTNSLHVMAAILQPPYFNGSSTEAAAQALNYAGAGVVAGHENSHGFDDQGRDYDGVGRLKQWWTPATSAKFEARIGCLIDQYSGFEVLPGVYVNGNLTIGENIADNGGVKTALRAYQAAVPSSSVQLFSVAYAQGWCSVASDQYLKLQVQTDVHSPAKFRAIGPLMNRPEFAEAFSCPVGSVMNPSTQCEVW